MTNSEDKWLENQLSYDKENEVFYFNGDQFYWSSIYILDKAKTGFEYNEIKKELSLDKDEESLVNKELHDLYRFELVNRKGSRIVATQRGTYLLRALAKIVPLENLRERAKSDLDRTEKEIDTEIKEELKEEEEIFCPSCGQRYEKSLDECPKCGEDNPSEGFPLGNYIINMFLGYAFLVVSFLILLSLILVFTIPKMLGNLWFTGAVYIALLTLAVPLGAIFTYILFMLGRFLRKKLFRQK